MVTSSENRCYHADIFLLYILDINGEDTNIETFMEKMNETTE
jgi:hypothetical protein